MTDERLTLRQAAARLGVSESAIRKRVERGTLRSDKGADGRRYVYLDTGADSVADIGADTSATHERDALTSERSERIEELRDEVHFLREQLHQELERRSAEAERYQQIVAALTTANASLSERLRALEPPQEAPSEERESPVNASVASERTAAGEEPVGREQATERPQQRNGWRAPVDKLPWWHYVLGLLLVFLGAFTLLSLSRHLPIRPLPLVAWQAIYLGTGLLPPSVFGFWVGFRQRSPRLRSEVIRFGIPVGVAFFLGLLGDEIRWHLVRGESLVETFAEFGSPPLSFWAIAVPLTVLPSWLLYVSGALIGNAWQRHRTGRMTGSTPITEWTPQKQAYLGVAGTIIGALINGLFATLGAG